LEEAIGASDDAESTAAADMQQASDDRAPSIDSADTEKPDDQSST
jgi:hypothetical protein